MIGPVLVTATLALTGAGCQQQSSGPVPVTGLIDATEIDVASKVPGRVREVLVQEGDSVKEGQRLVVIESEELQAKLDQAEAGISAAQAKLRLAQAGARSEEKDAARSALKAARHQADVMKKTYDRVEALLKQGAVPQAQFDEVEAKWLVAVDQLAMAESRYAIVSKGARREEIEALRALVQQGQGAIAEVKSYQKETVQSSPVNAEVSKVLLRQGELAATGYPIVTLVDLNDMWASFALREDLLKDVKKGTKIQAEVPALGRSVTFEVFHIAAMGDFATWKATTDKGGFDLKSFQIRARPVEKVDGLRPGMTVRWRLG